MTEYNSIHTGEEIDKAVTRATTLAAESGADDEKIMSQKAVTEQLDKKVDKVDGMGLSTNDFTNDFKTKLDNLPTNASLTTSLNNKVDKIDGMGLSTNDFTTDLKTKLNDLPTNTSLTTSLNNKVDKVTGKGLSTNDYTAGEKTKLDGIDSGATAVGKSLAGQSVKLSDLITVTAKTGAEIFNDYRVRTSGSGAGNIASGEYSHAEGTKTTASGTNSHAEGNQTTASGSYSHAEGSYTTASASETHAEGSGTTASGSCSHAEGRTTTAKGSYSHTEGHSTTASGQYSHAEGFQTTASGSSSHAGGSYTTASGLNAHAWGYYTIAKDYQTAIGKYNKESSGGTYSGTDGDAFIIGNGTSGTRHNAFRVTFAGGVYGLEDFSASGAGVAELFEWADGNPNDEDRRGLFVTLDGEKIRVATPDDNYILGMIDPCPFVVGDVHSEIWKDMYQRDIFGEKILETVEVPESTNEFGDVTPAHTEKRWVLNPDYDPTKEYVSRDERKEFAAITSKGKVVMIDDGTCEVNKYCTVGKDGKATASDDNYAVRVLKRIDENHIYVYIDRTFLIA